jgi:hypothetical protein
MSKKQFSLVLTLLFCTVVAHVIMAQPPGGGGGGGAGGGAPIDGGITALIAGVAIYGYRKIKGIDKQK